MTSRVAVKLSTYDCRNDDANDVNDGDGDVDNGDDDDDDDNGDDDNGVGMCGRSTRSLRRRC